MRKKNYQNTADRQKKALIIILTFVIFILVFVLGSVFQKKYQQKYAVSVTDDENEHKESTDTPSAEQAEPTMELYLGDSEYYTTHEIESYLFIGTDASGNTDAVGEEYRGAMADFLLLVAVDHTDESYGFLQLNRDTMTEITLLQADGSGYASANLQLCTAHWYGGDEESSCENTVEAVSYLLGEVPIDGYYALDMKAIPKINHEVGGVEVTIEDDFSDSDLTLVQGTKVLLNDEQAYHYIHDRMNVGDGENISRMRRQKTYMDALSEKVRGLQKEDQQFVLKLLQNLQDDSVTDLDLNQLAGSLQEINHYHSTGVHQIEGTTRLGQALGDGLDHTEFYPDEESLKEQMMQLYCLEEMQE